MDASVDRSTYLGSSDAAAILGVSKWRSPLDVYRSKVFPEQFAADEDPDKQRVFRRGRLLEPVIRQLAVEDYDLELYCSNRRHHDPEHDWMRAEIDFETYDPDRTLVNNDCKSVSPFAADQWGEAGTDEIPIDYHAQFQFGLMVTGRPRCDVWALFGNDNLVRYVVRRDEETIAGMRAKCVQFWTEHVLERRPPSPITIDDVEFLMRRLRGRRVEATPILLATIAQYREAKERIKAGEDLVEDLKFLIIESMERAAAEAKGAPLADEDACIVDPSSGKTLMTWKSQMTTRVDVKRLREEQPAIANQFSNTTDSRVLRLVKAK